MLYLGSLPVGQRNELWPLSDHYPASPLPSRCFWSAERLGYRNTSGARRVFLVTRSNPSSVSLALSLLQTLALRSVLEPARMYSPSGLLDFKDSPVLFALVRELTRLVGLGDHSRSEQLTSSQLFLASCRFAFPQSKLSRQLECCVELAVTVPDAFKVFPSFSIAAIRCWVKPSRL